MATVTPRRQPAVPTLEAPALPLTGEPATLDGLALRKRRTPLGDAVRTLRTKPIAMAGFGVIAVWLVLALLAPILPIQDPNHQALAEKLQAPGRDHPFGTDDLGRDMISRVIYGARISVPA